MSAPVHAKQASRLQLPQGQWETLLDGLCARFPQISEETWRSRFERGLVTDALGRALSPSTPYKVGLEIRYFREVDAEPIIPFSESIVYQDEHIVVADKPHFLPVMPAGRFVRETLLTRLIEKLGKPDLVPLHRIDRETAGLVMLSANPKTRSAYQALFRNREIEKRYEALAPALPHIEFPMVRHSRIVQGDPFFKMREVEGEPNSETRIEVLSADGDIWRYALFPVTGRKHQLRVQMAVLGAPMVNDRIYCKKVNAVAVKYDAPLQLVAKALAFTSPITKQRITLVSSAIPTLSKCIY